LSLEESRRSKKREIITIDDDDDDDLSGNDEQYDEQARYQADLRTALDASRAAIQKSQSHPSQHTDGPSTGQQRPGPLSFLAERAKLEKERLERQKRLRGEASLGDDKHRRDSQSDSGSDVSMGERPTKKMHLSYPHKDKSAPSVSAGASSTSDREIFWDGELRQTATRFAEPRKDGQRTFRLTQVLGGVRFGRSSEPLLLILSFQKSELAFAILSSYSLDFPWIYDFFDRTVPVIMVAQPDPTGKAAIKYTFPTWIKTTPVLRGGFGCQHMKVG
jgi:tyrosyl-DNA phosphodiesterase-1